ncbi:MAG: hypothetical protein QNJ75_04530 [Acidimicrobiia bacterium]|nr:hypothetical protein [Acidimicrobiia bacterium]
MDIAVNLVENYLRLTGYLTLSEFEVQRRDERGRYKTVTDIDIMGVRMPGDVSRGDGNRDGDCEMLLIDDPVLELERDTIDVIIGEVKQGQAELNPGIKDHGVLHSLLRRIEWLYSDDLGSVIRALQQQGLHRGEGKGGAKVRTRLVAFGRSSFSNQSTISLSHMITTLLEFFEEHEEASRPIQFREPAPAFLSLLLKSGFDVQKERSSKRA